MVQPRAGSGTVQIALRLTSDLRDRVKAAADQAGRSVNSELVATLEEKYPAPKNEAILEVWERMDALRKAVGDDPKKLEAVQELEQKVGAFLKQALEAELNVERDAQVRRGLMPKAPSDL